MITHKLTRHISAVLERLFADISCFFTFGSLGRLLEVRIDTAFRSDNIFDPKASLRFHSHLMKGKLRREEELVLFKSWQVFIPRVASYLRLMGMEKVFQNIFAVRAASDVLPMEGPADGSPVGPEEKDSSDTKVKKVSRNPGLRPVEV